jgi:hypothetical protein
MHQFINLKIDAFLDGGNPSSGSKGGSDFNVVLVNSWEEFGKNFKIKKSMN